MIEGRRHYQPALIVLLLLALPSLSAWGYVALRSPGGASASWKSGRFPLTFQVSRSLAASGALAPGTDAIAAVRSAMASWQSIPTADIRFSDLQFSSLDSGVDGINLITIADTEAHRGILGVRPGVSGAVAQTRIVFDPDTGEIRKCDIILNPRYRFSTDLETGTYDLQTIVTHELGHALGCDHSPMPGDTMFSVIGEGEFYQRYLSADAIAFASRTYPSPDKSRPQASGTISGRITSLGAALFGASVTAVNVDRNLVFAALSGPDGGYALAGLPAGKYVIYAEPLDGPMTPDQFLVQGVGSFYQSITTSFRTALAGEQPLGIEGVPMEVVLNLAAASGAPSLNVDRLGRAEPDSPFGFLAPGAVVVSPGEDMDLWVGGSETWKIVDPNQIRILGSGIQIEAVRGIRILRDDTGAPAGIIVRVQIAPNAAPGPRSLLLQVGNDYAAFTGGIVVCGRSLPQSTLYFPYVKAAPDLYTGIALANAVAETPAVVRMSGNDLSGALLWEGDALNPSGFTLPAGSQLARLEREYLNLPFDKNYAGSATVESDVANLQGFFLTGDFACSYLDGAEAFTRSYRQLFFAEILQDANTSTEIHLMNVKEYAVKVRLVLVGERGELIRGPLTQTIPPRGKIGASVASLFEFAGVLHSAHVVADSDEEALTGFELISQKNDVSGLNALPMEAAGSVLHSPQLAVGDLGLHMDTRVNLFNAGPARTSVTVQAVLLDDKGLIRRTVSKSFDLDSGAHFSADVFSAFDQLVGQGYLKVTAAEGSKLLGDIMFGSGDPTKESLKFVAAVPLFASGSQDFVFAHTAQGVGYWTGMAFLAPQGAKITVQAFDADGTLRGVSAPPELAPGQQLVSLLNQLIPKTDGQVGGYVRVTASQPVIGIELFGTTDGQLLSAVPSQRISK